MKAALEKRIRKMVEEEQQAEVDAILLENLRSLPFGEFDYEQLHPAERNALNQFFREVRELTISEMVSNKFGSSVVLDSIIFIMFDVGYRAALEGYLGRKERS